MTRYLLLCADEDIEEMDDDGTTITCNAREPIS